MKFINSFKIIYHLTNMRFAFFCIMLMLSLGLSGHAQQASDYLSAINKEFRLISENMMSYSSASAHARSMKKVESKRQEVIKQVEQAEARTRKMKGFNGSSTLRDSAVAYLDLSHKVLTEDFGKIMNLEEVAEQSYDDMEAYVLAKQIADEKLDAAADRLDAEISNFATQNKIKLIESQDALGRKIEKSSKVYGYYNTLYLIFFRSNKDEAYMLNALYNGGSVLQQEQTKEALIRSSTEGLSKLGPINGYNGDLTLKTVFQQMLNFYIEESQKLTPQVVDFQLKKENFDKVRISFEAIKENQRTQKDIETYNKALQEFNQAVPKINSLNEQFNKRRNDLLNNFERIRGQFLSKHVPKHRG